MTKSIIYNWIALLSIINPAASQVAENMPFRQFQEFPQAEIRNFSIGSYGFEAAENTYNPHYDFDRLPDSVKSIDQFENIPPGAYYSLGGSFNLAGQRSSPINAISRGDAREYSNSLRFRPHLGAKFWYRQFAAHISYSNEALLHLKQAEGTTLYQFSSLEIETSDQEIGIEKNTLQVSLSMLTSPSLSMALGVSTSGFRYIWDLNVIEAAEFESPLFKRFQYLFAANYRPNAQWRTYLTFKTQTSRVPLPEGIVEINSVKVNFPRASVSYYGHIGYGVHFKPGETWGISLEMRHQFLEVSDTSVAALAAGLEERHIWNNEAIFGLVVKPARQMKLGLLFSKYIKYDNNLDFRFVNGEANGQPLIAFARITEPSSLAISGEYAFGKILIKGIYQFSRSTYALHDEAVLEDELHLLSVNIGYHILW